MNLEILLTLLDKVNWENYQLVVHLTNWEKHQLWGIHLVTFEGHQVVCPDVTNLERQPPYNIPPAVWIESDELESPIVVRLMYDELAPGHASHELMSNIVFTGLLFKNLSAFQI